MTLKEIKEKVLTLIEEYDEEEKEKLTKDPDIDAKINHCIDDIQVELSTICRLKEAITLDTTETNILEKPKDMYKIDKIKECDFEVLGNNIVFDENYKGIVNIYYDRYPKKIDSTTSSDTELELPRDALECLVYGVASALLKADISSNYSVYEYKYTELKQSLNNANTNGMIWIE